MKKSDKNGLKIAGAVYACVAVLTVIAALIIFAVGNSDTDSNNGTRGEILYEPAPTPVSTPPPDDIQSTVPPTPTPEPVYSLVHPPDRRIDFAALAASNADFAGWITIPGTDIDYPVLKSSDNTEYLTTDINGRETSAGALFMDMGNDAAFADRLTVIYGHNMRNGSMFAGLHKFNDSEFFAQNRTIKLYTVEGMRIYEIISAYLIDERNLLYQTDYSDDDVWQGYIRDVYQKAGSDVNLRELPVGDDDQILALSTCISGADDQRLLVQGVLIKRMEQSALE